MSEIGFFGAKAKLDASNSLIWGGGEDVSILKNPLGIESVIILLLFSLQLIAEHSCIAEIQGYP